MALLPKSEIRSSLIQNIDVLLDKIKITPEEIRFYIKK